jgi:hypothetical protein
VTIMGLVLTVTAGLVVLLLLLPLAVVLCGVILFGLLGHVSSAGMVSRTSFDCPFSKRHASVEFVTEPGCDRPSGVLSCSVFAPLPSHVRCEKACLGMATTGCASSPMMPRYALLAGGVAYRIMSAPERLHMPDTPQDGVARAA